MASNTAHRTTTATEFKPRPDYPLTPHHGSGQWCKKLNEDAEGVEAVLLWSTDGPRRSAARYLKEKDHFRAGIVPPTRNEGLTLAELCNRFLHVKRTAVDTGEPTMRSWYDYHEIAKNVTEILGRDCFVAPTSLTAKVPHSYRYRLTPRGDALLNTAIYRRHKAFPKELAAAA